MFNILHSYFDVREIVKNIDKLPEIFFKKTFLLHPQNWNANNMIIKTKHIFTCNKLQSSWLKSKAICLVDPAVMC